MKSLGLVSQLLAIVIAATIGFFFVQPTVTAIGDIQTEIDQYKTERKKIESINTQLAQNLALVSSVSPADQSRLATYIPRFIDDLGVMRDIEFIVSEAGLTYTSLDYNGLVDLKNKFTDDEKEYDFDGNLVRSVNTDTSPTPHSFGVNVVGQYDEIKTFMTLLEKNHYPLEVHKLTLKPSVSGSGEFQTDNSTNSVSVSESTELNAAFILFTYVDELMLLNDN